MNKPRKNMKSRWSLKYKRNINCSSPRGFSQKNYCKRQKRGGRYLEGFKEWLNELNYLNIGHSFEGDNDSYVLRTGAEDITTAKKAGIDVEDFHGKRINRMVDFSGRIDHSKEMISITQQGGDNERLNYLVSILKQDFPSYSIWYFSNGLREPRRLG